MKNLLAMLIVAVASFGIASASLAAEKRDNADGAFSANVMYNDNRDVDGELDGKMRYSLRGEGDFRFKVVGGAEFLLGGEVRFESDVDNRGRVDGEWTHTVEEAYVGVGVNDLYAKVGRMDDLWTDGLASELSSNAVVVPEQGRHVAVSGGHRLFEVFASVDRNVDTLYREDDRWDVTDNVWDRRTKAGDPVVGTSMTDSVEVESIKNVQARLNLPAFKTVTASLMVDYSFGRVNRELLCDDTNDMTDNHSSSLCDNGDEDISRMFSSPSWKKDPNLTFGGMVDVRPSLLPVGLTSLVTHDVDRKKTGWQAGTDWKGLRLFVGGYHDAKDDITRHMSGKKFGELVETETKLASELGVTYNVALGDVNAFVETVYDLPDEELKAASGVRLVF